MPVLQRIALPMGQKEIMGIIPHRPPFLLVDKIIELVPGQSAKGTFFADPACDFFAGHFPGNPVMPGVLILEAINQVGAVALLSSPEFQGKIPVFLHVREAKFKGLVRPGDTLLIGAEKVWQRRAFGECRGSVTVNNEIVATATIGFGVISSL